MQHVTKITKRYMGRKNSMCGIVGYIGKLDARKIVLDGRTALEYRGYDSAGIE